MGGQPIHKLAEWESTCGGVRSQDREANKPHKFHKCRLTYGLKSNDGHQFKTKKQLWTNSRGAVQVAVSERSSRQAQHTRCL